MLGEPETVGEGQLQKAGGRSERVTPRSPGQLGRGIPSRGREPAPRLVLSVLTEENRVRTEFNFEQIQCEMLLR